MTSGMYELHVKQTFLNQLLLLPARNVAQIWDKIRLLCANPMPHGSLKKQLHGAKGGNLYRLRSGDYRILYTFGNDWISLVGVDHRKDVYREELVAVEVPSTPASAMPEVPDEVPEEDIYTPVMSLSTYEYESNQMTRNTADEPLPRAINRALLRQLRIASDHHKALLKCQTIGELCAVDVPENVRGAIFDAITTPNYNQVLQQQPDLKVQQIDDLQRYYDGDLMGFLLRLSPEQEQYVTRGLTSQYPMLLKGSAGTGKSTVAIYRAKHLLEALRDEGVANPRILFTTYTNALETYTRQLLATLVGADIDCFTVQTADSVARQLLSRHAQSGSLQRPWKDNIVPEMVRRARAAVEGARTTDSLSRSEQVRTILSDEYIRAEFLDVIQARQITTWEEYAVAARPGRNVRLSQRQRRLIWRMYNAFCALLATEGYETWQQMRSRAEELARALPADERYDTVIVDEAQDLNLSVLRMLTSLCKYKRHLFITADADQSIYTSGFRWSDVQDELHFRGRTRMLRKNYRSTRQIGEAAHAYVQDGVIEEGSRRFYAHTGERPRVVRVHTREDEVRWIAQFLPASVAKHRLGINACAILSPSARAGRRIAGRLKELGISATYMESKKFDLASPGVKVVTLWAAKGLEFPIVVLAGFFDGELSRSPAEINDDARAEWLARQRRTVFVGMTRAMRSLSVVLPEYVRSPVLEGMDRPYWRVLTQHQVEPRQTIRASARR